MRIYIIYVCNVYKIQPKTLCLKAIGEVRTAIADPGFNLKGALFFWNRDVACIGITVYIFT